MKTKLFWHTVRYAAFCRALIRYIAVTKNFVKPAAAGHRWAIPQIWSLLPDATGGGRAYFGGCEFIRYDDRPRSEKSSIVCKHLRRSFLSSPNKSRAASLTMSTTSCYAGNAITSASRSPSLTRCFPARIWTNWSAKSPKKSTTTSTLTISASSYAATVRTNSTSTPLTILINSIPLTNRAKSMKPEPSPNASSKVKRCC